jgi:predicted oxidoreductase
LFLIDWGFAGARPSVRFRALGTGQFAVAQVGELHNLLPGENKSPFTTIMQTMLLGVSSLRSSRLAYGCWRVAGSWDPGKVTPESRAAGHRAITAAYEAGYTLFDNADIYSNGEAERILGEVLKEVSGMRAQVLIATKCGIRPGGTPNAESPQRYDFSKVHIVDSCEQSLKRLKIDSIDLYMLHRPDFLADPEEIADAFSQLKTSGKVRYFGVSNFRPTLVTALQAACPMPLVVHQVEISLAKMDAFVDGTLDQCLIEKITPMAWSPLAAGLIGAGAHDLLPSQKVYRTERFLPAIDAVAKHRGASRTTVALAWLLKHPSGIQPIVGSINPDRIRQAAKADELEMTREEWYRLLLAARGEPLP